MTSYKDIRHKTAIFDFQVYFAKALTMQEKLLADVLELADGDIEDETEAYLGAELALYAGEISPFWTGALATSHTVSPLTSENMHFVHIHPTATNPITGDLVSDYGPDQHALGGSKAFYDRSVTEIGEELIDSVEDQYATRLDAIF